jgi:hypothetical protein
MRKDSKDSKEMPAHVTQVINTERQEEAGTTQARS